MSKGAHWLDSSRNVRRLWRIFLAALATSLALEIFISPHPHFSFDALFGFHAAYGLLACAAMIAVAKAMGVLLKRPQHYYDGPEDA